MKLRIGYELIYDCPQLTPTILALHVHTTRVYDLIVPDYLISGTQNSALAISQETRA